MMFNKENSTNLGLLIVKNHIPMKFVKITWIKCLAYIYVFKWSFFKKKFSKGVS
jgi:hypothetical protein